MNSASEVRPRVAPLIERRCSPMLDICHEILMALAAIATVAGFILEAIKEYKRQRMTKGDKEKTRGNGS